jgi:hypothetical protein
VAAVALTFVSIIERSVAGAPPIVINQSHY